MDQFNKFEFYYFKDGKYLIGFFEEKIWDDSWKINYVESRFRDLKFKYLQTLTNCFKRQDLFGYPSNTGINGWARQSIELNYLNIDWISNFSYEDTTQGFPPTVDVFFKGKKIKSFQNINTTKKFVNILNHYTNPSNVIKLIELEYGIEKCYKKIMLNLDKNEALKIFNS
jgi:hypothetical protein